MRRLVLKAAAGLAACAVAIGASAAFALTPPPDETLPSMKFVKGTPVSPDAAITAYGDDATHTNSLAGVANFGEPPEIAANAHGLKDDPDLIFEYVRNHIKTEFVFGSRKGALGALIDKSATPFDQNILFVEMVRAAGKVARYRISKATFTGQAFTDWTGISDRRAACLMLASGGIPAEFPGLTGTNCGNAGVAITSVTILHVWSQVKFGDDWFAYDPSYKKLTAPTPKDLAQASGFTPGYCRSEADAVSLGKIGAEKPEGSFYKTIAPAYITKDVNGVPQMIITGRTPGNIFGNPYKQPGDLARLMLHELRHLRYPSGSQGLIHQQIDYEARGQLRDYGLAGSGCTGGYGFPGCGQ